MQAKKLIPALAVLLLAMSAVTARAAAIAGVQHEHGYTGEQRSLFAPYRCPFADMRQVLQRNAAAGVFGARNEGLADAVILVAAEPGLAPRDLAQLEGQLDAGQYRTITFTTQPGQAESYSPEGEGIRPGACK